MGDYIALTWPPGQPSQTAEAMKAAILADRAWRVAHEAFCVLVCVSGARPPAVRPLGAAFGPGQGVAIGEVFDSQATREGRAAAFDLTLLAPLQPEDAATVLSRCAWGRYVTLFTARRAAPVVFRDPLGGLECVAWTRDEVTLVSSQVPVSGPHAPLDLAIDWVQIDAVLRDSALVGAELCLAGVQAVLPGATHTPADGGRRRIHWTPAAFARTPRRHTPADLKRRLDAVVAAQLIGRKAVIAEASGGLDSAIVATAAHAAGAPIVACTNHYWAQPEGDERLYAQALADRIGVPLTAVARREQRFSPQALAAGAEGPRPPYNAQDPDYDLDMAERLAASGADALFTGHGGDVVLFQMIVPAVAADLLARGGGWDGRGGLKRLRALASWAHRSRTSAWRLALQALAASRRPPGSMPVLDYLHPRRGPARHHPWLDDLRGVSPAKRYQIWCLGNSQPLNGESRRGRVADLIHPLLAQPIVELCLETPVPTLAIGARDRPFGRAAFAERLPEAILRRRGKGDVTTFYARSVAMSLDVLRPFLLDGRLVAQGVIDKDRLDALLDAEAMIWRSAAGEIMRAVFLEVWVRTWEQKLEAAERPIADVASTRRA